MSPSFAPTRDDEFYVLLKSSLPAGYRIEAEPQTAYYSEWLFAYKLYHEGKLLQTFAGDFRQVPAGSLIAKAHALLEQIKAGSPRC